MGRDIHDLSLIDDIDDGFDGRSTNAGGELEVGILAHQLERAAEGVADDFNRFRPRPEPRHVDVAVADRRYAELLHVGP